ncbi:MAG: 1-(5-phosphoribosyl)-5-[(5-phosphoribosylamino)methylideneamino]imidazole-4-carboxamide isomerase [Pirellulales bacterium]
MMKIWPAIDLRSGRCVRLRQGDYRQEMVFGDDPLAMARRWVDEGATCLHLVDLDGAKDGVTINTGGHTAVSFENSSPNRAAIASIVRGVDVACELGGGIRDEAAIAALLELGLSRLVIGTLALKQPDWFRSMCRKYPGRLVLGLDARDGHVATDGWLETSDVLATDLAQTFAAEPLAAIVYTDIAKDGMMQGPNVPAMQAMQQAVDVPVIASGGVTTAGDVTALANANLSGCIIGRALYEGTLTIQAAHAAAKDCAANK